MDKELASTTLELAKKNLEQRGERDIYKVGEGDRSIGLALSEDGNSEVSSYLRELAKHGVGAGAFKTWYNFSVLEQEVRFLVSEWPAMSMMFTLQERGIPADDTAHEAFKAFPAYARHLSHIDPDDINDSLPAESMPLVQQYIKNISENPMLAEGLAHQAQTFPSMNAWVRFQVLKTIDKP